jgi:L-threonylcarbamoyladenylate synthase
VAPDPAPTWPPSGEAVGRLREHLLAGGLALLPTDTVYGIAAALDAPAGVAALYGLKGRPRSQPCQVLLYAPGPLEEALAGVPDPVARAARALLPGPATCLVPDPGGRFRAAAGDAPGTVGLRAPRLDGRLDGLEIPLVATSANHSGGPDPATLSAVPPELRAGVGWELDAGRLPGTASAVVDLRPLAAGEPAELVRPGPEPAAVARALEGVGAALSREGSV